MFSRNSLNSRGKYDYYGSSTNISSQSDHHLGVYQDGDDKLFSFPSTKAGLSSGEGNLLPKTRHSFRYKVKLPGGEGSQGSDVVGVGGQGNKKRRSLPEILLHFAQRRPSRKNSERERALGGKGSEIIIHVEDFDDCNCYGEGDEGGGSGGGVGLKGSLGLPGNYVL